MKFLFFLIILTAVLYYLLQNTAAGGKIKTYFGGGYNEVEAGTLITNASLYSGKKVCAKGYYIESSGITVFKATFDADAYRNSIWIVNGSGKQILVDALGGAKGANAKLCGKFDFKRIEFGPSSLWDNQINVESFELLSKTGQLTR